MARNFVDKDTFFCIIGGKDIAGVKSIGNATQDQDRAIPSQGITETVIVKVGKKIISYTIPITMLPTSPELSYINNLNSFDLIYGDSRVKYIIPNCAIKRMDLRGYTPTETDDIQFEVLCTDIIMETYDEFGIPSILELVA